MHSVLKAAHKSRAKVVLTGDTEQLKAVEAGKPFAQLQQNGMATGWIRDNIRQKTLHLKEAVKSAFQRDVQQAVKLLHKDIVEVKDSKERYAAIAQDYARLSPEERDNTLVVSGTNEARKALNQAIRKELGQVGQGHAIQVLERKDFTKAQIKQMENYQAGDLVKPHRSYRSLGLKNGDLCTVMNRDDTHVLLKKPNGQSIRWQPHKHAKFSVYTIETRELALGDKLRITENDHKAGLINGEFATVTGLGKDNLKIQKENGQEIMLNTDKPLPIDHGYCSTVHAAQGKDRERVLIDADTKSLTHTQDNFYVAISRAKSAVTIYTNHPEYLSSRVSEKSAALEVQRGREVHGERQVKLNRGTQSVKQPERDLGR